MKAIKSFFSLLIAFELFCLILFFFYWMESGFDISIPIYFQFTEDIILDFEFKFDWNVLMAAIGIIVGVYILSGLNIVDSGLTDEGSKTVKSTVVFIILVFLLINSVNYILNQSYYLRGFIIYYDIFALIMHLIHYLAIGGNM